MKRCAPCCVLGAARGSYEGPCHLCHPEWAEVPREPSLCPRSCRRKTKSDSASTGSDGCQGVIGQGWEWEREARGC